MTALVPGDPMLRRFRDALGDIYGVRLVRIVLYGSHARGEAGDQSDVNIAVFLDPMPNRWADLDQLADLRIRFLDEYGVFFEARPHPAAAYDDGSPAMNEIRRDGLTL
jgi:predicted nucleotidyltransferase